MHFILVVDYSGNVGIGMYKITWGYVIESLACGS